MIYDYTKVPNKRLFMVIADSIIVAVKKKKPINGFRFTFNQYDLIKEHYKDRRTANGQPCFVPFSDDEDECRASFLGMPTSFVPPPEDGWLIINSAAPNIQTKYFK